MIQHIVGGRLEHVNFRNGSVSFIYQEAFTKWNMGYASAAAIILFLIVLAVTLFQFKNESKYAND